MTLKEGTYTLQHKTTYKHGFIDGYNKAKKTFYTEEEVLWMVLNNPYKFEDNIKEWFELFKKK